MVISTGASIISVSQPPPAEALLMYRVLLLFGGVHETVQYHIHDSSSWYDNVEFEEIGAVAGRKTTGSDERWYSKHK